MDFNRILDLLKEDNTFNWEPHDFTSDIKDEDPNYRNKFDKKWFRMILSFYESCGKIIYRDLETYHQPSYIKHDYLFMSLVAKLYIVTWRLIINHHILNMIIFL